MSRGEFWQRNAYPVTVAVIVLLGAWLRWPTLYNGFFSDDVVALAMANGVYAAPRSPLDLFDFTDGSHDDLARLMQYGSVPWWTVKGLRLSMMRPLASALTLLDYHWFGNHALPAHVHSMLWWIAMLLAVAGFLRDVVSPRVAALALLLFALEEGHTLTLGWLANRCGLIAMFFCFLGLRAHLRWRREAMRGGLYLSLACFALALSSGEWAFPLMGYVVAFQLLADRGSWRARALGLLPAALPSIAFEAMRALLAHGSRNSGGYTDPISEPVRFLARIWERMPVFFADLVFTVPAQQWAQGSPWRDRLLSSGLIPVEIWMRAPGWQFWHTLIGWSAILALALLLRWVFSICAPADRRELSWLLTGAALALVPMVASFPHTRSVLPAAPALCVALAVAVRGLWQRMRTRWRERARGSALGTAIVAGLIVHLQVYEAGSRSYHESRWMSHDFANIRQMLVDAELDPRGIEHKRVVTLAVVDHTSLAFAPYVRWVFGQKMPRSWWTLSAAPYAHDIYRPAPNVLELSTLGGTMMQTDPEQLYRAQRFPLKVGERVQLDGLHVEIMRLVDGFPQTVRFTFDKSVDDPEYVFLYPSPEGLGPVQLPEVGERRRYRKASFPNAGQPILRSLREPNVSCRGVRPTIDACRSGFGFSDCGGSSQPVWACSWRNDCRWFVGGCVAEDYEVSPCPAHDLCCQKGWPFEPLSFTHELTYAQRVVETLSSLGTDPSVVQKQFALDVSLDPQLSARRSELRCSGLRIDVGPCGMNLVDVAEPEAMSLRFVYYPPRPSEGWALTVEMVEDRAGEQRARVCRVTLPPLWTAGPRAHACPQSVQPVCAQGGSLTLNLFPIYPGMLTWLRGVLRADFADGLHVEAEL